MFCFYLLEACSFLMRGRKGVDPEARGGEEIEVLERGENVIRIYYVRKNLFSTRVKMNKKL